MNGLVYEIQRRPFFHTSSSSEMPTLSQLPPAQWKHLIDSKLTDSKLTDSNLTY